MKSDLDYLRTIVPDCLVRIVGNKKDLVSEEEILEIKKNFNVDYLTSAKTGANVEALFYSIGEELLKRHLYKLTLFKWEN